jgi:uncharacterized protein (UPF0371 family)
MKTFKGLKMLIDEKETRYFEIVISYNDEQLYKQKLSENFVMSFDRDFVFRIIASVNNFKYKPPENINA